MSLVIFVIPFLCGCEPYRIERHKRSPIFFNEQYVEGDVQRSVTLDDGTELIFEPIESQSSYGRSGEGKGTPFKIREELENGDIVLHALMPQHVLMNMLSCLRLQEYELIYDQLLAEQTRRNYEMGEGFDAFSDYMERNRLDLARLLTRMIAGLAQQQVKFTSLGNDVTRCRLRPQVAEQFKFKRIDVVRESSGEYKLFMVG